MFKSLVTVVLLCGSTAFAADMNGKATKMDGYISDSKCAATHNASAQDASCVKKCISEGAKPVFVDNAKKQVWAIDNPDMVTVDEGKPVTVMATADPSAMSVHVTKIVKVGKVAAPASGGMKME